MTARRPFLPVLPALLIMTTAAAVVGAPRLEWKSPFEGPVIDVHTHLSPGNASLIEKQVRQAVENNIIMLLIAPPQGVEALQGLVERYPGYVHGVGFIHPDEPDALEQIEIYRKAGFKGLKFATYVSRPRGKHAYSHPAYRPIFERAAELGMPCVFHTNTTEPALRDHPVHIDTLQREVEGLKVIGYHLSNPDFVTAGELMLKSRNLYFGMSGITHRMIEEHYLGPKVGRRMILDKFRVALWHPRMWSQLLFASDSPIGRSVPEAQKYVGQAKGAPPKVRGAERILRYKEYYRDWLTTLEVPEEIQYKIMYDNAAEIFGLPRRPSRR